MGFGEGRCVRRHDHTHLALSELPVNNLIYPSEQPEDGGAVIIPISQMEKQGSKSVHTLSQGHKELVGPAVQDQCSVTTLLAPV